jgi:hypothetical protein
MTMRNKGQMDQGTGVIDQLDTYLADKQELIAQLESVAGETYGDLKKVLWILKGLSAVRFPTWPYEWEIGIEAGTKSVTLDQFLAHARGTDMGRM